MAGPAQDPLSPGTHTVEVEGLAQRYHVHGGPGPVCVAHPGGPGVDWEYLRMPAVERDLTVVYVEPVGTGRSGRLAAHPHGYTRERYSRFLAAVIAHLGVPYVHLLGHSHGGFVAQYHALRRPERLAGLVLYESAPVTGPEHAAEAARQVEEFAVRHADRPELPAVLDAFRAMAHIGSDADATAVLRGVLPAYVADYWGDERRWSALRPLLHAAYISQQDENLSPDTVDDRAELGGLTVPALVLVGRRDVICGPRWAEELHRLIPGSRLVVLEHSGHLGHVEEPEGFRRAVVDFVRATPPPA